jgi:nucleotide-binding universal stress UspA family protein
MQPDLSADARLPIGSAAADDRSTAGADPDPDHRTRSVGPRIQRVLLATDLGPASAAATASAIDVAAAMRAALIITTVVDGSPVRVGGPRVDQLREAAERGIATIAAEARRLGVDATFLVWIGEAGPSIVAVAEAERADLIVLGTHGKARMTRFLVGSVSDHVVRHAAVPVLVVPPHDDRDDREAEGPSPRSDVSTEPGKRRPDGGHGVAAATHHP